MTPMQFAEKYLSKPIAKRFIYNSEYGSKEHGAQQWNELNIDYPDMSPSIFIDRAFVWFLSPEGEQYWSDIYQSLRRAED